MKDKQYWSTKKIKIMPKESSEIEIRNAFRFRQNLDGDNFMSHLNEILQIAQILHFTKGNVLKIERMVFDL